MKISQAKSFKYKLKSGLPSIGTWITIPSQTIAEVLCQVGFEWIVIDLEHSAISLETAADLVRLVDLSDKGVLVRVPSRAAHLVPRLLDAGAHGIITPNVTTADEALGAVRATRYMPWGDRGVGLGRAQGYGATFSEYLEWQANGPVVIVMIESDEATNNIVEITRTPGLDGILIGPYDLSASLGRPGDFESFDFRNRIHKIREAASKAGVFAGIHVVEPSPRSLGSAIDQGYTFLPYGVDFNFLRQATVGIERYLNIGNELD